MKRKWFEWLDQCQWRGE